MIRNHRKLAVQRGKVVEDVEKFVLEVVLDLRPLGIVAKGGIPSEFSTNLFFEPIRP